MVGGGVLLQILRVVVCLYHFWGCIFSKLECTVAFWGVIILLKVDYHAVLSLSYLLTLNPPTPHPHHKKKAIAKSNLLLIFLLQGKKFTLQPGVISVHVLLRLSSDGVGPVPPSVLLGSLYSSLHLSGDRLGTVPSSVLLDSVYVSLCLSGDRAYAEGIFSPVGHSVYVSLHLSGDGAGTAPSSILLDILCMFHSTFQVTGWGLHSLQSCWTLCVCFTPSFR